MIELSHFLEKKCKTWDSNKNTGIPLNRGLSKCYGVQLFWRAQWLSGQLLYTSYIFSSFLFIATHILPNISKSNEIWSVKRIQHKKYFFLKSCDAETSPRPFLKNHIRGYPWIKSLTFYARCSCCMSKSRAIDIWN